MENLLNRKPVQDRTGPIYESLDGPLSSGSTEFPIDSTIYQKLVTLTQ